MAPDLAWFIIFSKETMKKTILLIMALLPLLVACVKRDWTNPFSSDCPKEIWTPTNFAAVQEGATVKLT